MTTNETDNNISDLEKSNKRGHELLRYAYDVLQYDGIKLLHTAIHAGVSHVNHIMASSMLGYKPATLRNWHSQNNGPIQTRMINGKPFWAVKDIRHLLGE